MAGTPREKQVVEALKRLLKSRRAWHMKTNPGYGAAAIGLPDFVICYRGLFLAWEVKREGAEYKPSKVQLAVHDKIRRAGARVDVVRSTEEGAAILDDVDAQFVTIARCPEHGLHGARTTCFVCDGDVEQVPMHIEQPDVSVAA